MQKQQPIRRPAGAKSIALDGRTIVVRYYLLQLLALLLSAGFALGLHFIFGR